MIYCTCHILGVKANQSDSQINSDQHSQWFHGLALGLYTVSFSWQIRFYAFLTPRKSLTNSSDGSISASDSKMHKIFYPVKSNFIWVILTKYWQVGKSGITCWEWTKPVLKSNFTSNTGNIMSAWLETTIITVCWCTITWVDILLHWLVWGGVDEVLHVLVGLTEGGRTQGVHYL